MILGKSLIIAGLIAAIVAMVGFVQASRGRSNWLRLARLSHILMTLLVAGAAGWLMNLVLTHQFQYSYVARYSSSDLPLHFLISCFWAGQEGTFLLWALYTGLLGLVVIKTGKRFEPGVMSFMLLLQTFLLTILVKLSPFNVVLPAPLEGNGLNPLLQDYWMVIHPPLLFVGFASFIVPASFAMHAMAKGDTDDWVKGALPWTAFSVLVLGTAICLGGYWAYRTLGWGGYWGWDPVENSSFVPWLFSVGLLHGLMVQAKRGLLKRMNLFLAVSGFMLVLYSTFLTRSGVLGDFSVHSFVDLGINAFLVTFVAVFGVLGFGLYFWRLKGMKEGKFGAAVLTREYGIFLGALSVVLFAVIVLIGTSAPLLTRLVGEASNVSTSYYQITSVPFAALFMVLLSVTPLLIWGARREKPILGSLVSPAVLGALATVLLYLIGIRKAHHVVLTFTAATAFFVNLEILFRVIRANPLFAGGHLVHVGVGLMIVGILSSTVYDRRETVVLPKGQPVQALGYTLAWHGERPILDGTKMAKTAYDIHITSRSGRSVTVSPVMFFSSYNNGVMRRPAIQRYLSEDLYLAPQGVDRDEAMDRMDHRQATLLEGETASIGATQIQFVGMEPRAMSNDRIEIATILNVTANGRTEKVEPVIIADGEGQKYVEALASVDGSKIVVRHLDPEKKQALLFIRQPGSAHYDMPTEALYLEASVKPFIGLLWLGTFCCIGGLILSVILRSRYAAAAGLVTEPPRKTARPAAAGPPRDSEPERRETVPV